jgi:hypothetical protein
MTSERPGPPRPEHPEPCPSPASPFAVGDEVVIVSPDRWAGTYGLVVEVDRCGIEAHDRHVAIGECAIEVARAPWRLWFRFDELARSDLALATRPERALSPAQRARPPESAEMGPESLSGDLAGR